MFSQASRLVGDGDGGSIPKRFEVILVPRLLSLPTLSPL